MFSIHLLMWGCTSTHMYLHSTSLYPRYTMLSYFNVYLVIKWVGNMDPSLADLWKCHLALFSLSAVKLQWKDFLRSAAARVYLMNRRLQPLSQDHRSNPFQVSLRIQIPRVWEKKGLKLYQIAFFPSHLDTLLLLLRASKMANFLHWNGTCQQNFWKLVSHAIIISKGIRYLDPTRHFISSTQQLVYFSKS